MLCCKNRYSIVVRCIVFVKFKTRNSYIGRRLVQRYCTYSEDLSIARSVTHIRICDDYRLKPHIIISHEQYNIVSRIIKSRINIRFVITYQLLISRRWTRLIFAQRTRAIYSTIRIFRDSSMIWLTKLSSFQTHCSVPTRASKTSVAKNRTYQCSSFGRNGIFFSIVMRY